MQTVWNFDYANYVRSISLLPGRYKLECWGACGGGKGASSFNECAKGGYAKGEIILKKRTNLIVCVGQSGYEKLAKDSNITRTGFNGGGRAGSTNIGDYIYAGYGGGATDIRLYYSSTTWDSSEGLLSRILVAGGAGAISGFSYPHPSIGHGGGEKGSDGVSANTNRFSGGGSQYQGGSNQETIEYHGSFGKGGIGYYSVGGGGGWYGGGGTNAGNVAGGGSGYALTKDSYKPPGYIPTSEYWLENVVMTTGGNTTRADGYAKITLLQALPFLNISSYNSTQVTFKADHTDPTLLTKIEVFIDDTLKETITTDLTTEKTINYTLEDNALHTLKIVVTDSNNATAEKVLSISKGIAPLPAGSTTDEVTNKWIEIKDTFRSGKTSIINTLALKNIEASLNNTLVELSEKIKVGFDSKDASLQDLIKQLTQANNTISQLNTKYKVASGTTTALEAEGRGSLFEVTYSGGKSYAYNRWVKVTRLNFTPNIFITFENHKTSYPYFYCNFTFACQGVFDKDFAVVTFYSFRGQPGETTYDATGNVIHIDKGAPYMNENGVYLPVYTQEGYLTRNWYAIKFK
ncbi:glycine rich domain-containing protein [Clostridioides difficile]